MKITRFIHIYTFGVFLTVLLFTVNSGADDVAVLGRYDHSDKPVIFCDRVHGLGVDQVGTSHLVERVQDGDLEVFDVAPELVLADVDGQIAIAQEFGDQQFVYDGARLTRRAA